LDSSKNFFSRVGSIHSGLPKWIALFALQKTQRTLSSTTVALENL
jgi:hypothetical protein